MILTLKGKSENGILYGHIFTTLKNENMQFYMVTYL